jgi:hypothetical protein
MLSIIMAVAGCGSSGASNPQDVAVSELYKDLGTTISIVEKNNKDETTPDYEIDIWDRELRELNQDADAQLDKMGIPKSDIVDNTPLGIAKLRLLDLEKAVDAFKSSCRSISFNSQDTKSYNSYKGTNVVYRGTVLECITNWDKLSGEIRLSIEYSWLSDVIYLRGDSRAIQLEGSVVQVWGTMAGSYTYTSQGGEKITLPLVDVLYIERD